MESMTTFEGPERRSRIRFPLELGARFTIVGKKAVEGTGRTVNISSDGVLIRSAHEMSPGTSVTAVIEWPVLVGSVCPLALHIIGEVVRSDHGLVAVQFSRHELRAQPKLRNQDLLGLPRERVRSR